MTWNSSQGCYRADLAFEGLSWIRLAVWGRYLSLSAQSRQLGSVIGRSQGSLGCFWPLAAARRAMSWDLLTAVRDRYLAYTGGFRGR